MKDLLEGLCALGWLNSPNDVVQAYENLVKRFAHKGPPIGVKPTWLFRYISGPSIFEHIAKALEGGGAPLFASDLRSEIDKALVVDKNKKNR